MAHLGFARQIARRRFLDRTGGDIEFPDLCQLAYAGLLEAIDRFDPDHGASFRTYASRRISGSILDGIAKMSEVREQISFRNHARSERVRSLGDFDAPPRSTSSAMQALMDLAVGLAIGFMLEGTGLFTPEDQSDARANAYESLAWKQTINRVVSEIAQLPEREAAVVRHHYLSGLTFDQIGALLGVTKGRVSQIHKAAIDRLRGRLPSGADFRLER